MPQPDECGARYKRSYSRPCVCSVYANRIVGTVLRRRGSAGWRRAHSPAFFFGSNGVPEMGEIIRQRRPIMRRERHRAVSAGGGSGGNCAASAAGFMT